MFDFQAINMAAAHNLFIQGINAIIAHAPNVGADKVQPFMIFCLTIVGGIHHHHDLEEAFLFPELEKKLGKGTLSNNINQHKEFVPQLAELEHYLNDVKSGKENYDGALVVKKINSFSDSMFEHLNDEIPTLESSRIRAVFTETELKEMDDAFMKQVMAKIDLYTVLPMSLVCANPATPWFPPFPTPLKWAARWWFSRRHSEAWEFGPLDFSGNPRVANA